MFKKLFFLLSFLLVLSSASGHIYLISPLEGRFADEDIVELGAAQPGETVEVIISNRTGIGEEQWMQAVAPEEYLPAGWSSVDSAVEEETYVVRVKIPANANENIYNFKVKAKSGSLGIGDETINARLSVRRGLIDASIERIEPDKRIYVEAPVNYKVILNNRSIAQHTVVIDSSFSSQWFLKKELSVGAKGVAEYEITVIPKTYGKKDFFLRLQSALNNSEIASFNSRLNVLPTLHGKYSPGLHGFPFFTPQLLPFYIINSFLSLIIPP